MSVCIGKIGFKYFHNEKACAILDIWYQNCATCSNITIRSFLGKFSCNIVKFEPVQIRHVLRNRIANVFELPNTFALYRKVNR